MDIQLLKVGSPEFNAIVIAAGEGGFKAGFELGKNIQLEDEIGGVELAMKITGYSKGTIWNKTSKGTIPSHKDANQKTFYVKSELVAKMKGEKL